MGICLINLSIGDSVICIDDRLPYITKDSLYEVCEIYTTGGKIYIQIIDDQNYLNSYFPESFISISENRESIIEGILNN